MNIKLNFDFAAYHRFLDALGMEEEDLYEIRGDNNNVGYPDFCTPISKTYYFDISEGSEEEAIHLQAIEVFPVSAEIIVGTHIYPATFLYGVGDGYVHTWVISDGLTEALLNAVVEKYPGITGEEGYEPGDVISPTIIKDINKLVEVEVFDGDIQGKTKTIEIWDAFSEVCEVPYVKGIESYTHQQLVIFYEDAIKQ